MFTTVHSRAAPKKAPLAMCKRRKDIGRPCRRFIAIAICDRKCILCFGHGEVATLEGCQHAVPGYGVQSAESGALFELLERHRQQKFGYALIGKRIADHIDAGEIEHHTIVRLNKRKQLLSCLRTKRTCSQILSYFFKCKSYHNSFNSLSCKNASLYSAAQSVRLATTS